MLPIRLPGPSRSALPDVWVFDREAVKVMRNLPEFADKPSSQCAFGGQGPTTIDVPRGYFLAPAEEKPVVGGRGAADLDRGLA
jgi:hypothetical protein